MKELIIKKGDKQITVADKEDVMDALDNKSDNTHNHDSTYIKKTGGVSQHSNGNIIIPSASDMTGNDATGKIPFAGHLVSSTYSIEDFTTKLKSFIGGLKDKDNRWWNVISARQTNGGGSEAESNGLIFKSILDLDSNLLWNKQRNGTWGTERTILDSSNYSNYASVKNHTHKDEDILYNSNTQDKLTPLDMAFVSNTNKLAYLPANRINIWTSTDNGSTWNKSVGTDAQKINLVTTQTDGLAAGNGSTANYGQNQIRISLTFGDVNQNSTLYATVNKLLLRIGTHGALGTTVTVYIRKYNTSSYTQIGTFNVNGWTGWNAIPLTGTIGGYTSQTTGSSNNIQEIVLHFKQNSSSTGNLKVYEIKMVGEKIHAGPSQLGKTGHLYDMNENQDAIFPGKIIKSGGTSTQLLRADGSTGETITADKVIQTKELSTSDNLDNLTATGRYLSTGATMATLSNNIITNGGILEVKKWSNDGAICSQIYYSIPNNEYNPIYYRSRHSSGWQPWKKISPDFDFSRIKGTDNTVGYIKALKLQIGSAYQDKPIKIETYQRNRKTTNTINIAFQNMNNTDPGINTGFFSYYGDENFKAYLYKESAGVWSLITSKGHADKYGEMMVKISNPNPGINITKLDTHIASLPSSTTNNPLYTASCLEKTTTATVTYTDGSTSTINFVTR